MTRNLLYRQSSSDTEVEAVKKRFDDSPAKRCVFLSNQMIISLKENNHNPKYVVHISMAETI